MKVILISEKPTYWRKVIKKHTPGATVSVYGKHFDRSFASFDMAVIDVENYVLVEDALLDYVPTLCLKSPTKDPEKLSDLCELSEENEIPFVVNPLFTSSNTFMYLMQAIELVGHIYHVDINYNDPTLSKKDDILWSLGRETIAVMASVLDELPDRKTISGVGFTNPAKKDWIVLQLYSMGVKSKVNTSINISISRMGLHPKKEILITGTQGKIACSLNEKECILKDEEGRVKTVLETTTLSWEEQMYMTFVDNIDNSSPNGQLAAYTAYMCNEVEEFFNSNNATQHIDLSSE